jgi:hypothetical protein
MNRLLADMYVVCWKHFERQSSKDEDFLASAICGLTVFVAFLNVGQVVMLSMHLEFKASYFSSNVAQWALGAFLIALCAKGMRMFVKLHPEVQSQEGIYRRYGQMSQLRKTAVVVLIVANVIVLWGVHRVDPWKHVMH